MDMMITGRQVHAEEVDRMGLVNSSPQRDHVGKAKRYGVATARNNELGVWLTTRVCG